MPRDVAPPLRPAHTAREPHCRRRREPRQACRAAPAPTGPVTGSLRTSAATSGPTGTVGSLGRGLVDLPALAKVDPRDELLVDPSVPESNRRCSACREPVGRSKGDGEPGRVQGFCPRCRQPFDFRPQLAAGDLVADQYQVAGCLAHGGLGWIYLASDRNVADRWVVLKGALAAGDASRDELALAERRFLAEVEHPNIVKIYNFVEHRDSRFIVMEYVSGSSLRTILEQRRRAAGAWDPLPVDHAIAYVLDVLPALDHLHQQGLLYCDLKPDNLMRTSTSVKLIDLGAVYRIDDPAKEVYGTPGYQAPEIAEQGPSVASDVYTVGRTLAVLCADLRQSRSPAGRHGLPPADEVAAFAANDSFYRLLLRATAPEPTDRFGSVAELADQLEGVLREVVARERGEPVPAPSRRFAPAPPPVLEEPSWRSIPALLVAADDSMAGFLATIQAADADEAIDVLRGAPELTVEVRLREALLLIQADRLDDAAAVLTQARDAGAERWRVDWYEGLRSLAGGEPTLGSKHLSAAYEWLPGELAPKLALGVAAELGGDLTGAAGWFQVVAATDPSVTAALFGLARCYEGLGRIDDAVAAVELVPRSSSAHPTAQLRVAHLRIERLEAANPTAGELQAAAVAVEALPAGVPTTEEARSAVLEAALALLGRGVTPASGVLLGHPCDEPSLRLALEQSYRRRARSAPTLDDRVELIHRANRIRPRTVL